MKIMKKMVALLIVLVMTVSMLPLSAFANPDITFYTDSVTVAVGSRVKLGCDNNTGFQSFASDDESVVRISGDTAYIKSEGTANVTVTDGEGDTAVLEVVAVLVEEIARAVTSETTVTVNSDDTGNSGIAMFAFTAPEAGTWIIYSENKSNDTFVYYYDSQMNYLGHNDDGGEDTNFSFQVEMEAGETIYVNTMFYRNFCYTDNYYDVVFAKAVDAEAVAIPNMGTEYFVGDNLYITVSFSPDKAIEQDYEFSSDNEEVATVNSNGYVQFVGAGIVTVTVTTESGLTDSVTFTVSERPALESFWIYNIDSTTPYVGDYDWLNYGKHPEDASVTSVEWSSDNENVATVNSNGYVQFVGAGIVTITVTAEGGISDSVTFTVSERPALESIEIYNIDSTTPYVDDYDRLYYDIYPEDASVTSVEWSSDNENVATVSDGYVQFVGAGIVTITVTAEGGIYDSVTFTVSERPALESIEIYSIDSTTPYVGDYDWLNYDIYPEDASVTSVEWSSDNENVATVSDGYVQFVGAGTVTITVTAEGGIYDSVTFTVSERPEAESIVIENGASMDIYIGDYEYLDIGCTPSDAMPELTYSSDNEEVASVDEYGCVYALSVGTATITVTTDNGLSASVVVNVPAPPVMELDKEYYINKETNGLAIFEFVPTESGTYSFYSYNNRYDTYGYLYDENMVLIDYNDDSDFDDYNNFRINCELTAGETYYFRSRPYNESRGYVGGYYVKLIKPVPAESISFESDVYNAYAGSNFQLGVIFAPDNAIMEYCNITSDNPDVLDVYSVDGWCQISRDAEPCTITVTATTEDGLTATTVINIMETKAIVLNQPNEFKVDPYVLSASYTFTPETSGDYFVKFDSNYTYDIVIYEDGYYLDNFSYSGYIYLEAGVTYEVVTYVEDEALAGNTYNFVIADCAFTDVELVNAPTVEYILAEGMFAYQNDDGTFVVSPLDLSGIKLKVTYFDGTVEYLTDEDLSLLMLTLGGIDYVVYDIVAEEAGIYEATLYFDGYEFTYDVKVVENTVADVELVKGPKVNEYAEYFYPRYDGIQLLITYVDGTSETLTLTEDMIRYEFYNSMVFSFIKLEGIEIVIASNGSTFAILCNGFTVDFSEEITYNDIYPVDVTVTQFDGVDGMDVLVEFSDGSKTSLELDVIVSAKYGNGEEGYAMTDIGILYYGYYEYSYADSIKVLYLFDMEIEILESAMFVEGDVNNDGKLTAVDYLMMKKIVFSQLSIDDLNNPETALSRCDLSGDGKVTAADYLRLKRMIFTA